MGEMMNSGVYLSLQVWWRLSSAFRSIPARHYPEKLFYVVSHERSGTHFLINSLLLNLKIRKGKGVGDGAGWGFHNMGEWFGPYSNVENRFDHLQEVLEAWSCLSDCAAVVKTHSDRGLFQQVCLDAPVVYIVRDPRDTLVSWFHYLNQDRYYRIHPWLEDHRCGSFHEFLHRPTSGFLQSSYSLNGDFSNVVERWASHTAGWMNSSDPRVCRVHFSELKKSPEQTVRRIGAFLGADCVSQYRSLGLLTAPSMLPRKGVVGDWRTQVSPEDEDFIRKTVERYGLDWDRVANVH